MWLKFIKTFATFAVQITLQRADHLTVLYDPDYMKASVVLTLDIFWSTPAYLAAIGIVLALVGLIARRRRRVAFRECG